MRTFPVAALILVLAGCGGGSGDDSSAPSSSAPPTTPTTAVTTRPAVAAPKGTPAPEALSNFRCAKTSKGVWNASGYVSNDSSDKVTFQVTVYIGEATGGAEKARTRQVPRVGPKGSVRFVLDNVPAPKTGGVCHVQVLAQG
jgi:hypothetical protein